MRSRALVARRRPRARLECAPILERPSRCHSSSIVVPSRSLLLGSFALFGVVSAPTFCNSLKLSRKGCTPMPRNICDVPGCENEIPDARGSQGGLRICNACSSSRYYWRRQGPRALFARRAKLVFWTSRVDYLEQHIGKIIRQAKRRVAEARADA